jgi:hypothetical protein
MKPMTECLDEHTGDRRGLARREETAVMKAASQSQVKRREVNGGTVEPTHKMSAEGAMTEMMRAREGARPERTPIWIPSDPRLAN